MSLQMVRFRTAPEQIPEVTQQIEALFTAVHDAAPPGIRYLALREADEPAFTLILELPDRADNPLLSIPAALEYRSHLSGWTDDDVTPRPHTVLGRYSA
ncbi:hypothetical protein [Rhodococcus xishaensis]|uniref:Antibiotic biosynthesis monooxygenase n=1 Tax=Rhodococcus xishaensis TaxID=2487364 RepID=A0A438ARL0_9NOCA|nr:hypothetical protein [Rhodococcus xishaensis]RVW01344.1 hypothetical protein EGT50_14130 [Rhodococcus xishaensis]